MPFNNLLSSSGLCFGSSQTMVMDRDRLTREKIQTALANARKNIQIFNEYMLHMQRMQQQTTLPSKQRMINFVRADFIAHKLAYLLPRLATPTGTIRSLDENGAECSYQYERVAVDRLGLVAYVLYLDDALHPGIDLLFMGTDFKDPYSIVRNLEVTPGHNTILSNKYALLQKIQEIADRKHVPIRLNLFGHSLGASYAANMLVLVVNAMARKVSSQDHAAMRLSEVSLNIANAPGVTPEMASNFQSSLNVVKQALGDKFAVNIRVIKAHGDPVQLLGGVQIAHMLDPALVNVELLKIGDCIPSIANPQALAILGVAGFCNPIFGAAMLCVLGMRGMSAHRDPVFTQKMPAFETMRFYAMANRADIEAMQASFANTAYNKLSWMFSRFRMLQTHFGIYPYVAFEEEGDFVKVVILAGPQLPVSQLATISSAWTCSDLLKGFLRCLADVPATINNRLTFPGL